MFKVIKTLPYGLSRELPFYLVTCPNCKNSNHLITVYLGGTYECSICLEQFQLTKEHIIVVP